MACLLLVSRDMSKKDEVIDAYAAVPRKVEVGNRKSWKINQLALPGRHLSTVHPRRLRLPAATSIDMGQASEAEPEAGPSRSKPLVEAYRVPLAEGLAEDQVLTIPSIGQSGNPTIKPALSGPSM